MKKIFTKLIGVTLGLAMAVGVGVGVAANRKATMLDAAPGDEIVYKTALFGPDYNSEGANGYSNEWYSTTDGFIVDLVNWNNYNNGWTYIKAGQKKTAYVGTITTHSAIDKAITKVVVTVDAITSSALNSFKLYTSSNGTSWTEVGDIDMTSGRKEKAIATPTENLYYKVAADCKASGSNGVITISKVEYYYLEPVVAGTYAVSFNSNGGSSVATQNVSDSGTAKATEPSPAPTKAGYTFAGWYDNSELTGNTYDFNTNITSNITLYAKWEKVALTSTYSPSAGFVNGTGYRISGEVTAKVNASGFFIQDGNNVMEIYDATACSSVSVGNVVDVFGTYDSSYVEIKDVVYCDVVSDDTVNSQTPLTDLNDVTVANRFKYFEIANIQLNSAFNDSNKQASIKNSSVVVYYQNASYVNVEAGSFTPGDYVANDYVSVKGIVNVYNNTVIELQIVSIHKLSQFTVTFESNGGSSVDSQTVLEGSKATEPSPAPTKSSDEDYTYTFDAWCSDAELNNVFDFNTPINSNKTLYARYTANAITNPQAYLDFANPFKALVGNENAAAEESTESVTFSSVLSNNDVISSESVLFGQVSLLGDKASHASAEPKYYTNGTALRAYAGNTLTFSAPSNITRIEFTYTENYAADLTPDVGSFVREEEATTAVWTGSSATVVFSVDAGCRFSSMSVTYYPIEVNNVALRFGATLPQAKWASIASKWTISDYGVMLFQTTAANLASCSSVEDYYRADPTNVYVSHKGSGEAPYLDGENYLFSVKIGMASSSLYNAVICAAPFIVIDDTYYFLEEQQYSVKTLAQYYLTHDGCNLSNAALRILAN